MHSQRISTALKSIYFYTTKGIKKFEAMYLTIYTFIWPEPVQQAINQLAEVEGYMYPITLVFIVEKNIFCNDFSIWLVNLQHLVLYCILLCTGKIV